MTKRMIRFGKKKRETASKLSKLDLGCGLRKEDGWTGVDKIDGVMVKHDLTVFPWPFEDNSVEEARCIHSFEHIPARFRFGFMDELWRVLIPEGKCLFQVPYYDTMRAVMDPTHEWPPICEGSFNYFWKKWREDNSLSHYPVKCDFDFTWSYTLNVKGEWAPRNDEMKMFAIRNYVNSVEDMLLTVVKKVGR